MMRHRLRDEEGAVSILAAGSMVMLIIAAALAVDLGRLGLASRDVQGTTDRAALDAVRVLGDLRDPNVDPQVAAETSVTNSLGANGLGPGIYDDQIITVRVGDVDAAGNFTAWTSGATPPTAIELTNQVWVPFVFAVGAKGRTVTREAIVKTFPFVEYDGSSHAAAPIQIGTTVATVSTDEGDVWDPLYSDLLQGTVNLGVAGWQGLADADADLATLLTNLETTTGLTLTAGSPDAVLAVDVPLTDLWDAISATLTEEGDPNEVSAITAVDALGAQTAASLEVTLGDIIAFTGDELADVLTTSASVPVLSLAQAGVHSSVANAANAVALTVPVNVPDITSATMTLALIDPPQSAFGPAVWDVAGADWATIATTAQVRLQIDLVLEDLLNLTGLLPIDVELSILVDAGKGRAALTSLTCANPVDDAVLDIETQTGTVGLHLGSLAPADLTDPNAVIEPIPMTDILTAEILGPIPVLDLDGATDLTLGSSTRTDTMTGPFPVTTSGGTTSPGLADLVDPANMTVTATVLGALPVTVEEIQDELDLQAADPLTTLQTDVIEPLLRGLGVELGSADTTALEDPSCGQRVLVK